MSLLKTIKQKAKYLLPVSLKKKLKLTYYAFQDAIGFIKREKRNAPPRRLNFVGSSDFEQVGQEFFGHFQNIGQIQPDHKILDIGCGIGRMAMPLTNFLTEKGEYHGFDIAQKGIQWCQKNITPKHPNFHFTHVDIYNKFYNPAGPLAASKFKFPYHDNTFDFAFATSVFTHIQTQTTLNYLKEISRVLKPGGTAFITFFLLDPATKSRIQKGQATARFQFCQDQICHYSHKDNPEAEIAYPTYWLKDQLTNFSLDQDLKIHPGSWSKPPESVSYQDIVVCQKR